MRTTHVILAAEFGTRCGGGINQLEVTDPNGVNGLVGIIMYRYNVFLTIDELTAYAVSSCCCCYAFFENI